MTLLTGGGHLPVSHGLPETAADGEVGRAPASGHGSLHGGGMTGINPGKPMVRDPGLVMRGTGWTIARRLTGGYVPAQYYCLEMAITGKSKASAHKARVTDCV